MSISSTVGPDGQPDHCESVGTAVGRPFAMCCQQEAVGVLLAAKRRISGLHQIASKRQM